MWLQRVVERAPRASGIEAGARPAEIRPLVPELTYRDLVIVDGLVASVEIARLLFVAGKISPEEVPRVRKDLLEYSKRDTWAMVKLLDNLRTLA